MAGLGTGSFLDSNIDATRTHSSVPEANPIKKVCINFIILS
jgi:hypothetical protein